MSERGLLLAAAALWSMSAWASRERNPGAAESAAVAALRDRVAASTVDDDRERPLFELGAQVRVILNDRNRTPHVGTVAQGIWHHKLACWTYFLEERGRRVSKRYLAEDLERVGPRT